VVTVVDPPKETNEPADSSVREGVTVRIVAEDASARPSDCVLESVWPDASAAPNTNRKRLVFKEPPIFSVSPRKSLQDTCVLNS